MTRVTAIRPGAFQDDRCPQCGDRIINPGAHWERCTGPRAYGQCQCEPGWLHDPTCWLVTGDPPEAA